jgi:hypothetical protein
MVAFGDLVSQVPEDFSGIVDFSACEAHNILPLFKARAPNCIVKVLDVKLSYIGWLGFYVFFFQEFLAGPVYFADALLRALTAARAAYTSS